jgi:uncharacterized protein YndB with AHSA1/START domain
MDKNRIEKKVLLHAPRERVWRAISDSRQFGRWFGVKFDGPFVSGGRLAGKIVPTSVDPEVAKLQKPYEGMAFECVVESVEPMKKFSFRWHPFAVETGVDYSKEPMTLVQFVLKDASEGILLTISESGFDQIPKARRAEAIAANEGGWAKQTELIQKYLAQKEK